jgi:hypothetical protein
MNSRRFIALTQPKNHAEYSRSAPCIAAKATRVKKQTQRHHPKSGQTADVANVCFDAVLSSIARAL